MSTARFRSDIFYNFTVVLLTNLEMIRIIISYAKMTKISIYVPTN